MPNVTQLVLIARVYYKYLLGILDMLNLISQQCHKVDIIIIPSLQMWKLRLRKAEWLTPDHRWQSWDVNPGLPDCKAHSGHIRDP